MRRTRDKAQGIGFSDEVTSTGVVELSVSTSQVELGYGAKTNDFAAIYMFAQDVSCF